MTEWKRSRAAKHIFHQSNDEQIDLQNGAFKYTHTQTHTQKQKTFHNS